MVIGERGESLVEKLERHIKETEEDKAGWERELEFAIKHQDENHRLYCDIMIDIMKNTLCLLNQELVKYKPK